MAGSTRRGNNAVVAGTVLAAVVVAAVAAAAAVWEAEAAVACGDAVSALIPCGPFLVGAGAAGPSERCCRSAMQLRRMADTADARRALCRCLEQSGPSFGVLPERARQLPARCKLGLAIPIGNDTDCDKIP